MDPPTRHVTLAGRWLRAGLRVSIASVVWTLLAGGAAVVLGLSRGSLVLAAFGATGLLDAAGSAGLIVHFHHALRHEALSARLEQISLRIVSVGMAIVALATAAEAGQRLALGAGGHADLSGVLLAGASIVVLAGLAWRKRLVARAIPSHALLADSWLSGTGALLAVITVAGTGITAALGWWWLDPVAAIAVACVAISLSIVLGRGVIDDDAVQPGEAG